MTPAAGKPDRYGALGRSIHWLVAAMVVGLLVLGEIMHELPLLHPDKFWMYQLHKSLGFSVLALMAIRVIWRLTRRVPALPAGMPHWQRLAAHGTHAGFYVLMLMMPLAGWAIVSTSPFPVPTLLWGVVPIPHIAALDAMTGADRQGWSHLFMRLHAIGGKVVILLIALHVGAALYHHLWVRDGLLARMIPGLRGDQRRTMGAGSTVLLALLVSCALLACSTQAIAADAPPPWRIDAAASTLKFEASVGDQVVTGAIATFSADIRFDPAAPETASISVTIDLKSLTTGAGEVDSTLQAAEWFDTAKFPTATLTGKSVRRVGEGSFELTGDLTMKGVSRPVTLPFTLTADGSTAKVVGALTLDRTTYGIGQGAAAAAVRPEVGVRLELSASR
jgi:cytochrome b561/polyisoprenoid-binding protein YceI